MNLIFVVTKENCIVIRETANLLNNQQELNCNIVQIVKVTETVKWQVKSDWNPSEEYKQENVYKKHRK